MIMYQIEIRHDGLNKYRLIRGSDKYVVEQKAAAQHAIWNEMWQKKMEKENKIQEREEKIRDKEEKNDSANEQTVEAKKKIEEIENVLKHTLTINDAIDWDLLKDKSKFMKKLPQMDPLMPIPQEPNEKDSKYQPKYGLLDKIFSSRKQKKIEKAKRCYQDEHGKWLKAKNIIIECNTIKEMNYKGKLTQWETEKQIFIQKQKETNEAVDKDKERYINKEKGAILDYCEMVLSNSIYPDNFPKEFDLDYTAETKILIVNYSLPNVEDIPKIKEVKYIQTKDEFVETYLNESAINKLYDSLIYQMTLRTIHEIFEADIINVLDAIVFNGWVRSIDKAKGKEVHACIVTIETKKTEFLSINLEKIEPKTCFKSLKGIGSSQLHSLTPIAPIMNISREDKRFVSSYEVAKGLDDSTNLAAMDWEDFEHLIRELFEKEFIKSGGEVKVTQASRDGGVDAVAFDPDPIRGGKIVIQAKRYTNTVGVSAVRDLYGTVMNEGATKGILVTTSDYGPDAYEFAKDKPLTLLNGGNLLHLLEKHGHKANIDIKAAKEILSKEKQQ